MLTQIRRSIILAIFFAIVVGLAYPLVETGLANVLFPSQAKGSITQYGSTEIGQHWTGTHWFHGRPDSDNDTATGGTNLGPRSKQLLQNTKALVAFWHAQGVNPTQELVTTSGSQVDPDISQQSAIVQIPMIHRSTGISSQRLLQLIKSQTTGPQYGIFGDSYVNVLSLNRALAAIEHR
ncbi:potassium-transporting ATPase subunit C [Ferrimicrobium acidiphilum]|jgi:K+-transporting ATPase ATPase C chain|uniref:potassium-transporting ATPase subunit C n=1 Tax=Ferrimicrobium acidiphilum TaxID=121039 RepID=UPI0023F1DA96|nr:potassium-transporting ATPase subunit C [Ferrimicrobium acidiphilum]